MRWLAVTAAIIAGLVDAFYLGIVERQQPEVLRVPFVAGIIALMAVAAALAARQSSRDVRPILLGLSAGGLLAMGIVGIFSIGFTLLIAGGLAFAALALTTFQARQPKALLQALAGMLGAVMIVAGGFELIPHVVSGPPTGFESSSGQGLLGDAYSWSCDNGKLTMR